MRFRIERDALAEAVSWASRILPQRPQLPVLAGLSLTADTDGLAISGFDYEVSVRARLAADVAETGQVLVSGRLLAEITRSLPAAPVELETEGTRVRLLCGNTRFALATLPLEEYPSLPDLPEVTGTIGADAFAAAVASVAVAAGREESLPVLTGIRMEIDGERLTLAATDRYRLAVRELSWAPRDPGLTGSALVPARTLAETARSLTSGAEVSVALSMRASGEGMAGFVGANRSTTTRLIDGEFPKYRSLLPSGFQAHAQLETSALVEAVKRVSLVAARHSPVRLRFDAQGLTLEAAGGEDAQASESLPATFQGEDISIAFNPSYLLDGLGAIDSDIAHLSFTEPVRPAVLTGKPVAEAPGEHGDFRYLLMPVRLTG